MIRNEDYSIGGIITTKIKENQHFQHFDEKDKKLSEEEKYKKFKKQIYK